MRNNAVTLIGHNVSFLLSNASRNYFIEQSENIVINQTK